MSKEYRIPVNIKKGGYVLNGLLETRKAVEAIVGALLGLLICQILPLKGLVLSIVVHVFVIGLLGILGLLGVRGEPFSLFFLNWLHWKQARKKPFIYNPNGETFASSPTKMIFEERDAGDVIADVLDSFKSKFAKERPEYIEGETFTFCDDPLVTRLQTLEEIKKEQESMSNEEQSGSDDADLVQDINVLEVLDALNNHPETEEGDNKDEA